MKKNRNERLYLDYVQHGKNKTIIAPYSPRKTETGTVATPLYWEELKTELNPKKFTIKTIVDRVKTMGCPWLNTYNKVRKVNYITLKKYIFSSRSEEHTSELQSRGHLVCRLLLEKKKKT